MGELSSVFKYGYWSKLVRINLTDEKIDFEIVSAEIIQKYLGAKGFAAYYLCNELKTGIDPLGMDNKIIIAAGPFQGTSVHSAGRFVAASKSPLTNLFLDSYAGGRFGHVLKKCGIDAIIIEGIASKPTYISVVDDDVELHSASALWGKTTAITEKTLRTGFGKKCAVVSIGPAGENKVRFACLISDFRRAAGRGGLGAVFGSKNLKAVVVCGDRKIEVADEKKIKILNTAHSKVVRDKRSGGEAFYKYGTSQAIELAHNLSRLPTRNFQNGQFEYAFEIGGQTIHRKYHVKRRGCSPCTIKCDGWLIEKSLPRPEYESIAMLGANCGIRNINTVISANTLCNKYGLDTISTGNVIGFAMECVEKDLLAANIKFGDCKNTLNLISQIAYRKGFGKILAEGTYRIAQKVGGLKFAMNVKGLEVPAWDPRGKLGAGLAYMTADIGASHLRDAYTTKKIPTIPIKSASVVIKDLIKSQNWLAVIDSYIFCMFALWTTTPKFVRDVYEAVTGISMTERKEQEIGMRIWNLIRVFNVREGISSTHDKLPARFLTEPIKSGVAKGCCAFISRTDATDALKKYYKLRGWSQNGVPLKSTLKKLLIQ